MVNIILPKGLMLDSYIQIMFIISLQPSLNLPIQDRGQIRICWKEYRWGLFDSLPIIGLCDEFSFLPCHTLRLWRFRWFCFKQRPPYSWSTNDRPNRLYGLELRITEQLSLEGRIKGGFWSVTKANTNEYPFRYDPKNVVYQVGIVYYFNTDVWRDK